MTRNVLLGDITEKLRMTISASFQNSIFPKSLHGITTPRKDEYIIIGSSLGPKSQTDLLEKKFIELEIFIGIVEKLDEMGGLRASPASLVIRPVFLASVLGASDFFSRKPSKVF